MTAVDNTNTGSIQFNSNFVCPKNRKEIGELIDQFKNSSDGVPKTREEIKEYISLIKKQYRGDKRKLRLENKSQSGSSKTTEQSATNINPIQVPSVTTTTSTNDSDEQSVTTTNTTNSNQTQNQVPSVTSTTTTTSTNDSDEQCVTTTNTTNSSQTQIQAPSVASTTTTTTSTNNGDDVKKSIKELRELIRKLKKSSETPKSKKEIRSIQNQEKSQTLNYNEFKNTKSENVQVGQNTKKPYCHHYRRNRLNDFETNVKPKLQNESDHSQASSQKLEKLKFKKEMLLRKISIVENKIETLNKSQSTTVSL
ncbi:hypothetical protein ACTFIT_002887 [Dictyostelium discoideum]